MVAWKAVVTSLHIDLANEVFIIYFTVATKASDPDDL